MDSLLLIGIKVAHCLNFSPHINSHVPTTNVVKSDTNLVEFGLTNRTMRVGYGASTRHLINRIINSPVNPSSAGKDGQIINFIP